MSKLKQRIIEDMKSAMKAKDKEGLKAIRMILGANLPISCIEDAPDSAIALSTTLVISFSESCAGI
jgi:uncharacterized protein YqeY